MELWPLIRMTSNPSDFEYCLQAMVPCITDEMNLKLMAEFAKEQVEEAIFKMNPLGPSSPYGFPMCFYHKHWQTIGKEVCHFVIEVLNQRCPLD